MKIVEPDYYPSFRCTGPACEDSCCSGMGVVIDKATYQKYQACGDSELGPLLREKIVPNPASTHPATYALVMLDGAHCPFLSADKLCRIHSKLGEGYLSRTCDTYPRGVTMVDDTMERSLYLSCPEAARVVLLNPSPIRFCETVDDEIETYGDFPSVDTSNATFGTKPYSHFDAVRRFVIELLQNRKYAVWERMVILATYCSQMTSLAEEDFEHGVPQLTDTFREFLFLRQFDGTLDSVTKNTALLLNVVVNSLEDRIATEYTSPRFLTVYNQFLAGIKYRQGATTDGLSLNYGYARVAFYQPFIESHDHIWENFLVSKAHGDMLPFGPQKSLYPETRTVFDGYIILAMQYLFARTLVVGVAGELKEEFTEADIVRVIQATARAVEHNGEFMNKILRSLSSGRITELPVLATLIKE